MYKLVLDQSIIDEYGKYYLGAHPKAKESPIKKPRHPGLNEWMIMRRIRMNALKQRWKEFGIWWIQKLGLEGLKIEKFEASIKIYMPSRRRFDLDNYGTLKFLWDAFVDAGFIVDDDSLHLKRIITEGGYDKENPRTEILIRELDE